MRGSGGGGDIVSCKNHKINNNEDVTLSLDYARTRELDSTPLFDRAGNKIDLSSYDFAKISNAETRILRCYDSLDAISNRLKALTKLTQNIFPNPDVRTTFFDFLAGELNSYIKLIKKSHGKSPSDGNQITQNFKNGFYGAIRKTWTYYTEKEFSEKFSAVADEQLLGSLPRDCHDIQQCAIRFEIPYYSELQSNPYNLDVQYVANLGRINKIEEGLLLVISEMISVHFSICMNSYVMY